MKAPQTGVLVCASVFVTACLAWACDVPAAADQPAPLVSPPASKSTSQLVSFPSGTLTLQGFLFRPEGNGPFPAVLWNHGSEKLPGSRTDLAQFYTANGFVFFVPHRHGHGRSPGDYIVDLQSKAKAEAKDAAEFHLKVIALHELYLKDTIAALAWLKQQNFVDTNRIVMSGVSYGGIQTVLAAEKDLGVKAYLPFAPGAMSWQAMPELHDRLLKAVKQSHAPMFLLQAENDYNLGPSEVLGGELKRLGAPNQAKVYPPYGETHQSGHGAFACRGTNVWGADVLSFMKPLLEGARAGTQTARQ